MTRDADRLVLSRLPRARLDVWAQTRLPDGRRGRIAHQVRQDLWRALQNLRGFAPVVELTREAGGLTLRAGGSVAGPVAPGISERIEAVLTCPRNRARWMRHAGVRP